ncbi:hypothetical protein BC826DRAFT_1051158 [Russula brevipes]|nr:hypothetical protein BC826DRAFT_1051158 [Russula brevipes]
MLSEPRQHLRLPLGCRGRVFRMQFQPRPVSHPPTHRLHPFHPVVVLRLVSSAPNRATASGSVLPFGNTSTPVEQSLRTIGSTSQMANLFRTMTLGGGSRVPLTPGSPMVATNTLCRFEPATSRTSRPVLAGLAQSGRWPGRTAMSPLDDGDVGTTVVVEATELECGLASAIVVVVAREMRL